MRFSPIRSFALVICTMSLALPASAGGMATNESNLIANGVDRGPSFQPTGGRDGDDSTSRGTASRPVWRGSGSAFPFSGTGYGNAGADPGFEKPNETPSVWHGSGSAFPLNVSY